MGVASCGPRRELIHRAIIPAARLATCHETGLITSGFPRFAGVRLGPLAGSLIDVRSGGEGRSGGLVGGVVTAWVIALGLGDLAWAWGSPPRLDLWRAVCWASPWYNEDLSGGSLGSKPAGPLRTDGTTTPYPSCRWFGPA
jgi:hypothetical protein